MLPETWIRRVSSPLVLPLLKDLKRCGDLGLALVTLLVLMGGLAEGIGLAMIIPLVGLVASPGQGVSWLCSCFSLCGHSFSMELVLIAFVLTIACRAIILALRDRQMAHLETSYVEQRRLSLIRALAQARWEDVAGLQHTRLTFMLAGEINRLATAVRQLASIGMGIIMLATQFILLSLLSWRLALVFSLAATITAALAVPTWRRASRTAQSNQKSNLAIVDLASQLLGGLKLALAQNMQNAFVMEMQRASDALTVVHHAHERKNAQSRVIGATMAASTVAVMVWIGLRSGMAAPALIASLAIAIRMLGPGMAILRSYQLLAGALPAHAAIEELVAQLNPAGDRNVATSPSQREALLPWSGAISLSHLSYRNENGTVDFRDINLAFTPGAVIGLSGPTGAGKTSFVDLLCGLLEPQTGNIEIDGHKMSTALMSDWRNSISYLAQDCYLFHDTLHRNLTWGISASATDIALALETAEALGIVQRLPDGLETMVGERGIRLSGGERQRLALARALIRRPRLLILDEATSALDLRCEGRILQRLAALPHRPTIMMASHRPEALAICDTILNFSQGRLIS